MLQIHTTVSLESSPTVGAQFVHLVNRLLPNGWRFSLSPMPILDVTEAGRFSDRPGIAGLQSSIEIETVQPPRWRAAFRDALRNAADRRQVRVELWLTRGSRDVMVGQFGNTRFASIGGHIDVADLSRLPPEAAAGALAHELEEQRWRQGAGFADNASAGPHGLATMAESTVAGATRLPLSEERSTPGGPHVDGAWRWWIPFQIPGGRRIRALRIQGQGRGNISRADFAMFGTIGEFRAAALTAGLQ